MAELKDLELLVRSRVPLLVVETHEEGKARDLLVQLGVRLGKAVFLWTVTQGLRRLDMDMGTQAHNADPAAVLRHIKASSVAGIYVLADFHPFLDEALNVRLIKEIALEHASNDHTLVLLSHELQVPAELERLAAQVTLKLPDQGRLVEIVKEEAKRWSSSNGNLKVKTDSVTLDALVRNLRGLTERDARRLARAAIVDDGAITHSDLPEVMQAKQELLNRSGVLAFEYDTERFGHVGGMRSIKQWLEVRKPAFACDDLPVGLDPPKGLLLLGVQGCGKSLVAKAVAGLFHVPLLRMDFGALYNRFFGESERNLREALTTAEVMAPCVLWIDEIEKGVSTERNDGGTSRRILGTLLTWMAERKAAVFLVATANDIQSLPPELIRKGRFDEVFFVDLPRSDVRENIFEIHLRRRDVDPACCDLDELAHASEGFSGAEIEQAVVSALYRAHAARRDVSMDDLRQEISATRPLSRLMAEKISALREWAADRTVPAD